MKVKNKKHEPTFNSVLTYIYKMYFYTIGPDRQLNIWYRDASYFMKDLDDKHKKEKLKSV